MLTLSGNGNGTDRHCLNACIMAESCIARLRPCVFWTVVVLFAFQGHRITGSDVNVKDLIADVPVDPVLHRKVKIATWKVFWSHVRNGDDILITGIRSFSARDILTEEELHKAFPKAGTLVGPVYRVTGRLYGRDVTYPLSLSQIAAALHFVNAYYEGRSNTSVLKMWFNPPAHPHEERVSAGLGELLESLPGPPSPSCGARFPEEDFRSVDIGYEVWYTRSATDFVSVFVGDTWYAAYNRLLHGVMLEMGFPETYCFGWKAAPQPASALIFSPKFFTPALSYRFTLMMQGTCLYPFTVEKQTALRMVMEKLIVDAGFARVTWIHHVSYAPPFLEENGSCLGYFFINVTIAGSKYEGTEFKNLSQMFGAEGPFAFTGEGGPSAFQTQMQLVGLPIVSVKATGLRLLSRQQGATQPDEVARFQRQFERARRGRRMLVVAATFAAIAAATIAIIGFQACKRFRRSIQQQQTSSTVTVGLSTDTAGLSLPTVLTTNEDLLCALSRWSIQDCDRKLADVDETVSMVLDGFEQGNIMHSSGSSGESMGSSAWTTTRYNDLHPFWDTDDISTRSLRIARRKDGSFCVLGNFSSGQVMKCLYDGVHEVAVKVFKTETSRKTTMKEMLILKNCRHSNIVQYMGACFVGSAVCLVLEYMPGGDLRTFLDGQTNWTWGTRAAALALDVARGLAYLHSQRVLILDLKSSNVLLTSGGNAKIADVGISRLVAGSDTQLTSPERGGTFPYMAPEIILENRAAFSADLYSFGVLLWELVTGQEPIRGQLRKLRFPEDCPEMVAGLVDQCMSANPSLRPTAKEVALRLQTSLY